jgi:hypothetical protein
MDVEQFLSTVQRYVVSSGIYSPEESSPGWIFVELFHPSINAAIERAVAYITSECESMGGAHWVRLNWVAHSVKCSQNRETRRGSRRNFHRDLTCPRAPFIRPTMHSSGTETCGQSLMLARLAWFRISVVSNTLLAFCRGGVAQ